MKRGERFLFTKVYQRHFCWLDMVNSYANFFIFRWHTTKKCSRMYILFLLHITKTVSIFFKE